MNRIKGIFVAALMIACLLITIFPITTCAEEYYPDLIVTQCKVQEHWFLNNWWTAKVKVKNVGNYDADDFYLRLEHHIIYEGFPPSISINTIKEWYF